MKHFFTTIFLIFSISYLNAESWNNGNAFSNSDQVVESIDIDSILQNGFDHYRDDSELLLRSGVLGLEASRKVDYKKGEARSLLNLVIYHTLYGEKDSALILSNESIHLANQINEKSIIAYNRHYRGLSYQQSGKYQEALAEYAQSMDINRELGDDAQLIRQSNNVALVYRELKDYESAKNYLDETYELAVKVGNEEIQIISKVNQGYILIDQEKYEEAYKILHEAMSKLEVTNKLGKAIYNRLMAQALTGLGRFDESIKFANKAIDISKELNYGEGVFNAQFAIADTYFHDGKYQQAIRIAEEATKDPNVKYETRYVHQIYQILSASYRQLGNLNKAIEYQDEYLRLNEQIYNEDQQRFATRLKIEYDIKESKRENEILKKQSVADKKQIKNQQYYILPLFLWPY